MFEAWIVGNATFLNQAKVASIMAARTILEISGGLLLIVLGLLFIAYLGTNPSELATDVIFVGAGILIIRRAFQKRTNVVSHTQSSQKTSRKQR